jgi:hypothetical protein
MYYDAQFYAALERERLWSQVSGCIDRPIVDAGV